MSEAEKYEIHRGQFGWALEEMRRGLRVRRKIWVEDARLWLNDGVVVYKSDGIGGVIRSQLNSEDIIAEDWQLFEGSQ